MAPTILCTSYASPLRNSPAVQSVPQNTGQEFDGSDSGARPDEAVSWGKIRAGSESVKAGPGVFPIAH